MLDSIFGGSTSSRLFREVREKRGLAYSVGSYNEQFTDQGLVATYVGTREDNVEEACSIIGAELARLRSEPVSAEELTRAKESVKGRLVLSSESTAARMTRISRATLFGLPIESLDEMLAKVDAIEVDDLTELAAELYGADRLSAACVGARRRPLPRGAGAGQRDPGSGMIRVAARPGAPRGRKWSGRMGGRLRGGRGRRRAGAERPRRPGAGGRAGRGARARPTSSSTSPSPTPPSPTSAPASRRASTPSSAPPASTSTPPGAAAEASQANCFVAPNFAIGAVLLMEVSQTIATHMPECEIVELHHDKQARRPLGHREADRGADRRGRRQRPPADPLGAPARAWSPTRK